MSYVESNLVPGETVIYQTRLHWIVMLGHLVVGCLLLALPGVLLFFYAHSQTGIESGNLHVMEGGAAVLLVSGIVVILAGMVRRNATEMAVTNRRVVIKTGLASRQNIGIRNDCGDWDRRHSATVSQSRAPAGLS